MADIQEQVLELRSAGVPFPQIAEKVRLPLDEVRAVYARALDEIDVRFDIALAVRRVDRLLSIAWRKAVQGDMAAVDRIVRLEERRERLTGWERESKHEMRGAFDQTVEALGVDGAKHAAAIAAGRVMADRIDASLAHDERTDVTKSLYLVPHLINVLRELGATPAAEAAIRGAAAGAKDEAGNGRRASLTVLDGLRKDAAVR